MKSSVQKKSSTANRSHSKTGDSFFSRKSEPAHNNGNKTGSPFFDSSHMIQPQLKIHPSDDVFEKEADAMADRVTSKAQSTGAGEPNEVNTSKNIQTKMFDKISRVQRKPAFESPTALDQNSANQTAADELPLQRKAKETETTNEPDGFNAALDSSKGQGSSLPKATKEKMESGFGSDFSNVKVHTDSGAAAMNDQIGAKAFTHGTDIYFNRNEYKPNTTSGDHLLAHELTHTVQQTGGVQRKTNVIQKKGKGPDIRSATPQDLKTTADKRKGKPFPGEIIKNGDTIEVHLKKVQAKFYLTPKALEILDEPKAPIKIKKPRQERDSHQAEEWRKNVKPDVKANLKKSKKPELADNKIHSIAPKGKKGKGKSVDKSAIYGNLDRLSEEIMVPPWDRKGKGGLYDIEHKLDYQIAQGQSDNIDNLILLDRTKNRELGSKIEGFIDEHLKAVIKDYAADFSGITEDPKAAKNRFNVFIDTFKWEKSALPKEDHWENADVRGEDLLASVEVESDSDIPKGHFLIMSSDQRAAYLLPLNAKGKQIGGFSVTVESKAGEVTKILMEPKGIDDPTKIIQSKATEADETPFDKHPDKDRVYIAKTDKRKLGSALKGLIGGVKGASPIELNEPELDGFNIKVTGKVVSTLSILKNVDISFGYENGDFFIRGEIPLTKLAANIPKPFVVTACSIILEASSAKGLSVSGNALFKIDRFGEGEIVASVGKKVAFTGYFNFESKWFNPASVTVGYADDKWSIKGNIGIKDGVIKGVKEASLQIMYSDGTLSADGNAKLEVPGIDSVKLSASYSEGAGFKFIATADLKKLPGIKSGSVTVSILSKGEEIKLGVGGTAVPDFPGVPGLTSTLTVMYEDGVFDMRAKVGYKKGKFDGAVEVGVTNKAVDEKGQPQGEPKKGEVIVFGYGSLTVDLFKGSKGTISVRLTPEKQLLVAGSFTVKDVKPFGDGVNIKKGKEFPSIKIPLVGIPGVSIFFEIGGGAYFTFTWDPLVLKELTIAFKETNINEIESAQVDIHGEIGSKAVAEAYMELKASLGAEVLIAEIKGSLAGQAGIRVVAEAGGSVDATWNNEKGLQLKEVNASLSVDPKAFFRLKGSISVDLDLWVTTINLYYKEWTLAEGEAELGGLALRVNFPIKFDEEGNLIRPGFEQLNVEKPDFSGDQGKAALDSGINADAKKERKLAQDKLRQDIAHDIRESYNKEEFSPTEYAKKLQKKYKDDAEMKAFIMDSVEEEVRLREYEEFDLLKNHLRQSDLPLSQKMGKAMVFKMFRARISSGDYDAFINELRMIEQQKQEAANQATQVTNLPRQQPN